MPWTEFTCPHCSRPFRFDAGPRSQQVHCPACDGLATVPGAAVWHYARGTEKRGPFAWDALASEAAAGRLRAADLVWLEGTPRWHAAASLPGLMPEPSRGRWLKALAAVAVLAGVATGVALLTRPTEQQHAAAPKAEQPAAELPDAPPKGSAVVRTGSAEQHDEALAAINAERAAAGLAAVSLDPQLSAGCQAHAAYLIRNAGRPDVQAKRWQEHDTAAPGGSAGGREAARVAAVRAHDAPAAVAAQSISAAGRAALLDPDLHTIGIGSASGEGGGWFTVLDPERGRGDGTILYPAAGQSDVPRFFTGWREIPGVARGEELRAGYPVTVTFPHGRTVQKASARLRVAGGADVDIWLSTPENPAAGPYQRNSICLIAKAPLAPQTAYLAEVVAEVDGQPWSRAWPFTTEGDGDAAALSAKALERVNEYRKAVNLAPVELDPVLTAGCVAHARYLAVNAGHAAAQGLRAHDEDPKLPGFSEEGRRAGKAAVISWGHTAPVGTVDAWMATFYHRVPFLAPQLRRVGFGHARRGGGWVTVLDVTQGRDDTPDRDAIAYPADGQGDVPLAFAGPEVPNPIPQSKDGRAGYPVTVTFAARAKVRKLTLTLQDPAGAEVPAWLSTPERPANPNYARHQGTTACLIARAPLKPETTYSVSGAGEVNGKPWSMNWTFTTGKGGFRGDAAAHALARINAHRRAAGLAPVALDGRLARGCAAHAAYLVRHADHPSTQDDGVFRADPKLPGYSGEGADAGRNSDVLSPAPSPLLHVEDMMGTLARRVPLLDPALERVGFGAAEDVGRGWTSLLDHVRGRGFGAVLSPADGQTNVPRAGSSAAQGYPILVSFPAGVTTADVTARVRDGEGNEVAGQVSTESAGRRVVVALTPSAPLRPATAYRVTFTLRANGRVWERSWEFTTVP